MVNGAKGHCLSAQPKRSRRLFANRNPALSPIPPSYMCVFARATAVVPNLSLGGVEQRQKFAFASRNAVPGYRAHAIYGNASSSSCDKAFARTL
ncbi:hypothetical protein TsFJ059_001706 [Trichoderma semiorbis]|uniref:Uncharacterized protein n=1 Tax=Trichoderma semiorbis TaxID=1491008 RepID=A0A9P8HUY8_9HYPO|nr:hypothetical protein TsFJ059_001706 [Trichoderma semiorbis]